MGRSVTVTGRGVASAAYDVATLRLAATARAANPSDATARATYAMSVRTTDLGHVGSVLVAAVDAGGDGARVDGVSFSHDDAAALERQARDLAWAEARTKAEQYAALAGQALGEVRHIVETGGAPGPMPKGVAFLAASPAPPVDSGEGAVASVLSVTWALGPAV